MNDSSPQLSPDLDASSDSEVQEALSKRYSIAAIVTPLESGRFAVFHNDRSLDSLVICSPEDLPIVIASRAKLTPRKTTSPVTIPPSQLDTVDFSDL